MSASEADSNEPADRGPNSPLAYPIRIKIEPRFGDVDMHGHLNNVAQARYYEEGIARFHRGVMCDLLNEGTGVVGEVRIRYLAEGYYPAPLTLGTAVCHIGRASYAFEQGLWQEGRQISVCWTRNVYRQSGGSIELPQSWRERLGRYLNSSPTLSTEQACRPSSI